MAGLDGLRQARASRVAARERVYHANLISAFGSTHAVVAWTMTGYTLAMATVIPVAGWAADQFGTKRLFAGAVMSFTVGSLLCSLAPNITFLIAFRVFQGCGGGMLSPLAYTILTREAGPNRLGRLIAVLGIPMLCGPIAGPVLSGWLIDNYGWQWIFLVNPPIGVTATVLAALVLPKDRATRSEAFDVIGMLLLSPGLAAFLYGISAIPKHGAVIDRQVWLPVVLGLALIGWVRLHALYRADNPLIDLRLFQNRAVTAANSAVLPSVAAFLA